MKGDRMAKRSSFGSIVRKRLSDITNSLPQTQQKSPIDVDKVSPDVSSMKDYINHLAKVWFLSCFLFLFYGYFLNLCFVIWLNFLRT